tara:strand:- start:21 stop:212 length:192 start_codon:yes stop_codon:yes gene_type:complete
MGETESIFKDLTFTDIFETFDEDYLIQLALTKPKQLERMCVFLSIDLQIRKEKLKTTSRKKLN